MITQVKSLEHDLPDTYIATKMDWDWNVIDVTLEFEGETHWMGGFDDFEWKEAKEHAERLAKALSIPYVGEIA